MSKPKITITDFTKKFAETIKQFKNDEVLVGIPASDSSRVDEEGEGQPINNATILAINEFGSPRNNIPPRPVMAIGIRNAQDQIADELGKAASAALTKGLPALDQYYNRAGIIASTSIKKAINAQEEIEPPSEATLRKRMYDGFKGTKALIVTGQLRNAITYVIKGKAS